MVKTAVEADPQLIAFILPSIPESVPIARFHIRAALRFHSLDGFADNAEIITSELVTNAIQHVGGESTGIVRVALLRVWNPKAVTVVGTDSSPADPVMCEAPDSSDRGRGLRIVDALSDCWGWHPEGGSKAVYAVLAGQAGA
jgi:anti-sigma regulatory factor (Ser/Thr protein kinase)